MMAVPAPDEKTRTIYTTVNSLCIGDFLKVSGEWQQIIQIHAPTIKEPVCLIQTSNGIVEAGMQAMFEVAA